MLNSNIVKTNAKKLRTRLKELGYDLTHGHSLEAIAAAYGMESWNHLSASLETPSSEQKEPIYTRFSLRSTSENLSEILVTLQHANCKKIILLATLEDDQSANTPLIVAVALISDEISNQMTYRVFDGNFLTARRYPRYLEVKELLDHAVKSGKVYFSEILAPLTENLTPHEATKLLLRDNMLHKLNETSRPIYFKLLSPFVNEKEIQATQ